MAVMIIVLVKTLTCLSARRVNLNVRIIVPILSGKVPSALGVERGVSCRLWGPEIWTPYQKRWTEKEATYCVCGLGRRMTCLILRTENWAIWCECGQGMISLMRWTERVTTFCECGLEKASKCCACGTETWLTRCLWKRREWTIIRVWRRGKSDP